jgi:hypothetical protein
MRAAVHGYCSRLSTWDTLLPCRLARAHCFLVLYNTMRKAITGLERAGKISGPAVAVLRKLTTLLGVSHILGHLGDYMEDGYLSGGVRCCRQWLTVSALMLLACSACCLKSL